MKEALSNVRVLDVSNFLAGPAASLWLADFGADVIKAEHPRGDGIREWGNQKNGIALFFKYLGRNKRCITLNLQKEIGRELFLRLVRDVDVVVENFRPGTLASWGIGYEQMRASNPDIILLSISAFGQEGPYASRPGLGTLAEAMSGYASITGSADGPPTLPGFGLADTLSGIVGAYGVLAALNFRNAGGGGQHIDVSLLEPLLSILGPMFVDYDQLGIIQGRLGSRLPFAAPRNIYLTGDEKWLAISSSAPSVFVRTMEAMDLGHLVKDPRFVDNRARSKHSAELDSLIQEWVGARSLEEAMDTLVNADAAAFPVYDVTDIFTDEHIRARGSLVDVVDPDLGNIRMQSAPIRMSSTGPSVKFAGRPLGFDNECIYRELLGLSAADLARLGKDGVI